MFSFPLDFVLLVVTKFNVLVLHLFNFCFKFHGSFCSFWNFEIFSTVKLSGKFHKNQNKNFQVKCHRKVPVAGQGVHPWPRRPGGATEPLAAPHTLLGPTGTPCWHLFFHSLSFTPKTRVLALVSCSCCARTRNFDLSLQPIV